MVRMTFVTNLLPDECRQRLIAAMDQPSDLFWFDSRKKPKPWVGKFDGQRLFFHHRPTRFERGHAVKWGGTLTQSDQGTTITVETLTKARLVVLAIFGCIALFLATVFVYHREYSALLCLLPLGLLGMLVSTLIVGNVEKYSGCVRELMTQVLDARLMESDLHA